MEARELAVHGAYTFTPQVFTDDRGIFVSPFQLPTFSEVAGHELFALKQISHSLSRRDVVRGIHYTATPPGTAKYLYCAHGRALDIVVDLRTGSPTFGCWDAVELNPETFRATYFPVGVGHAFVALEDETVMSYMLSRSYEPRNELAVSALDPAVGLPVPAAPVLSERDGVAPTLQEAADAGLLPRYEDCRRIEDELFDRRRTPSASR